MNQALCGAANKLEMDDEPHRYPHHDWQYNYGIGRWVHLWKRDADGGSAG